LVCFFQAEDGIRDFHVTGVQTCALPISDEPWPRLQRAGDGREVREVHEVRLDAPGTAPGREQAVRAAVAVVGREHALAGTHERRSEARRVGTDSTTPRPPACNT